MKTYKQRKEIANYLKKFNVKIKTNAINFIATI